MAKSNTKKKVNDNKRDLWILFVIFVIFIPFGINILVGINTPLHFPVVGGSKDWLMFWATYSSAVASFMMVWYTSKTLKQNDNQLEVIKNNGRQNIHQKYLQHLFEVKIKGLLE